MPTINATVYPGPAYVLVQADWSGAIYRNTFSTVSASNWPAADTGQLHTVVSGVNADFTTDGFQGWVTHTAVNTEKLITADVNMLNVRFSGYTRQLNIPAGATMELRYVVRFVDTNNFIDARIFLNTVGTISINIRQRVAGVETITGFPVVALATTGIYGWTLEAIGPDVRFRVWDATLPEPLTWNLTFVTTWLTAGDIGIGSTVPPGVTTPLPIIFYHDNLVAVDPTAVSSDCAIVTRRNTVTGETVQLRPYIFFNGDGALILECGQGLWWDTEPPLNVPLEYCTFACDSFVTVSTNPDFDTTAAGWSTQGGATLTQDCTVAKVGTCSGRITPNGTSGLPGIFQSGIVLAEGLPVVASTWAMSPQGWNTVILRLIVTYSDLTSERLETDYVTLDDGEWRYISLSFTPRLPVTSAIFSFVIGSIPPNTTLFNVDDLKVTQATEVTASACETVTVSSESVWLKSPFHPCLDVEIGLCNPMLQDCDEETRVSYAPHSSHSYAPNTVLLGPANRRRPIPISRPRRDASAALRLIAHDCAAKDAILAINAPGDPLLFQAPSEYCIPDRYITVGVEDENYLSVDQREQFRLMVLPYETTDRPEGPADGPCGTRFADLCDIYSSWGALALAGLSWTDLLLGEASPNGPGQPDPPAGARTWDEVEAEFADWDAVEAGGTRDWDELRDGL